MAALEKATESCAVVADEREVQATFQVDRWPGKEDSQWEEAKAQRDDALKLRSEHKFYQQ